MSATGPACSYIDPGTGSMLFTLLVGLFGAAYFVLRRALVRLRFLLTGGRAAGPARHASIVVFGEGKQYWNVFGPICDELERRGVDAAYWTTSPDDPSLSVPYEHVRCEFVGEGNRAWARLNTMSADICIATTPGLDVYQWRRSRDVGAYVHTFHTVGTAVGYRMFGMDFYDAVLRGGEFQEAEIRELERARGEVPKELEIVGSTYLDAMAARLAASPAPEGHETTVLLAPSWGPAGMLSVYGARIVEALLATGYRLVVRPHPQSRTSDAALLRDLMARYPDGEGLEWNFDTNNFDVLARSDVMVTDFSGVAFDYALVFDRPLVYTEATYDPSMYDAAWLERPQWRFEAYPSLGVPLVEEDFGRMREVIDAALADEGLAKGRAAAREVAWQRRGQAARLTADYLLRKRDEVRAARGEAS